MTPSPLLASAPPLSSSLHASAPPLPSLHSSLFIYTQQLPGLVALQQMRLAGNQATLQEAYSDWHQLNLVLPAPLHISISALKRCASTICSSRDGSKGEAWPLQKKDTSQHSKLQHARLASHLIPLAPCQPMQPTNAAAAHLLLCSSSPAATKLTKASHQPNTPAAAVAMANKSQRPSPTLPPYPCAACFYLKTYFFHASTPHLLLHSHIPMAGKPDTKVQHLQQPDRSKQRVNVPTNTPRRGTAGRVMLKKARKTNHLRLQQA